MDSSRKKFDQELKFGEEYLFLLETEKKNAGEMALSKPF
jgi:hypothetical protein